MTAFEIVMCAWLIVMVGCLAVLWWLCSRAPAVTVDEDDLTGFSKGDAQ